MPIFRREQGRLDAVRGNYAILDQNGQMPLSTTINVLDREYYSNHQGSVDNYLESIVSGTATAVENTVTHEMDLTVPWGYYSIYKTKDSFTPNDTPKILSVIVDNLVGLADGAIWIGLIDNFISPSDRISLVNAGSSVWLFQTYGSGINKSTPISILDVQDGDLISFIITKTEVTLTVNKNIIKTHAAGGGSITGAFGVGVHGYGGAISASVDMISLSV